METTLFWKLYENVKPDGRNNACVIAGFEIVKNHMIRTVRYAEWLPTEQCFQYDNFQVILWAYLPTPKDVQF